MLFFRVQSFLLTTEVKAEFGSILLSFGVILPLSPKECFLYLRNQWWFSWETQLVFSINSLHLPTTQWYCLSRASEKLWCWSFILDIFQDYCLLWFYLLLIQSKSLALNCSPFLNSQSDTEVVCSLLQSII